MTSLSVVIPVKDDAAMLQRCLADLAAQSRPPDQVVVVDNGSTDDSASVAEQFGVTVVHEPSPGIWAAAATGYDAASGDIIVRCDADSRLPADWIETIERVLAESPDAVAVSGPGRFYDLSPIAERLADLLYMQAYFGVMKVALGNRVVFGSNFALRSSAWRRIRSTVHRHDPQVHDDMDLAYHLEPGSTVLYERAIAVGISGRPFTSLGSMVLRTRRAMQTVFVHGPWDSPPSRWFRRLATLAVHRARASDGGRAPREHQVP